ncbi:hypothetical protein J5X98_02240 [Leptothermofonsia sichuanensis E412]|uniref:DUF6930 domain-containing protein n=1 Tax=Leptothermofonsia sichuanensis TaxID=2917832 RepID=UPI001CA71BB4|nr:hypothetical protein [Leptothermofonsia sichuanensis]QZZ21326.1 hypothetical protein J5X98_02240 [Leptothermofonsia sichuanensis E412]
MTPLNRSTCRRLQQLPQLPSVWEGDRRPLAAEVQAGGEWGEAGSSGSQSHGDCILWVDGSMGMVRAMDVVSPDSGPETVVRTLLRAMEHPHNPGTPARPQKIVVRDREILFFLRGVLQDLDIVMDYVPDLPLIDEIFRGLQDAISTRPPQIPPEFAEPLHAKALEIWQLAPWEVLADHQIIGIEINQWDVTTLYASIMGMLGMEYGILLYRSLDSLRRFRQRVLADDSIEQMEEAFLGQDCLFITFECVDDEPVEEANLSTLPMSAVEPVFGNLHPLEGLRSFLYEEEAAVVWVALEAIHRFMRQHRQKFENDEFPAINSRYRIPILESQKPAQADKGSSQISVKVFTLPDLAAELFDLGDSEEEGPSFPVVRDDLVPENSFLSLGVVPWDMLDFLRSGAEYHQPQDVTAAGDGLPVVMIQTSRPKAKTLIQEIKDAGGLQSICFNPGEDPFEGDRYDLGLFQTGNGELHLFGEFGETDPVHVAARKKWDQRCKKTKGYCGLIIARGLTGANRGNPQFQDMMALFETRSLSPKELGLGTLQLAAIEWM